jgi:flavin-dependent dehydrogenase
MYDVIVVGARCAGSPTAMLLARKGHRVLLLERAEFPSDTVSTHAITGDGSLRLQEWGLLDRVFATGCPPVHVTEFSVGGQLIPVEPPAVSLCPRRYILDDILASAAKESGVDVRMGSSVRALMVEDGRVCGVRYVDSSGEEHIARATIVVGADGRNSVVAGAVGAEAYDQTPGSTFVYYTYWRGVPQHGMEVSYAPGRATFLFPTNEDTVLLAAEWPRAEFATFRADPLANLVSSFRFAPGALARIERGEQVGRLSGMLTPDSYFRHAWGPGWALAGDAGNFKDPILGQGINDAFRSAGQLADAIDAGLRASLPMDVSLAAYEALRDKTSRPSHDLSVAFAELRVTPAMVEALAARIARRPSARPLAA